MKIISAVVLCTFIVSALGVFANGSPVVQDPSIQLSVNNLESLEQEDKNDVGYIRLPRFTCDVLSFQSKWVTPNHSACAVRCLSLHKRGGRCKNGICVCR